MVLKPRQVTTARPSASADGLEPAPPSWAAAHADQLDVLLLLGGLLVTAVGAIVLAQAGVSATDTAGAHTDLGALVVGLGLVWSLGAPIVDILSVSGLSQLLTVMRIGAIQASIMGYLSAAGSVGRIAFPAAAAGFGTSGAMTAAAIATGMCVIAVTVFYAVVLPRAAAVLRQGGETADDDARLPVELTPHGTPFVAPNGICALCCRFYDCSSRCLPTRLYVRMPADRFAKGDVGSGSA